MNSGRTRFQYFYCIFISRTNNQQPAVECSRKKTLKVIKKEFLRMQIKAVKEFVK